MPLWIQCLKLRLLRKSGQHENEDRSSISKYIKVLGEMQGVDQRNYFFALDLFEKHAARETFISLKSEKRLLWLQGKFNASAS